MRRARREGHREGHLAARTGALGALFVLACSSSGSDGGSLTGAARGAGSASAIGGADAGTGGGGGSDIGLPTVPGTNDADGGAAFDASVGTLGVPALVCGAATAGSAAESGTDAIEADTLGTPGGDSGRVYLLGSPVQITFTTRATSATTVNWSIRDAWQKVQASGSFPVAVGPRTTRVSCTSTLAGYLAIAASLGSGESLPQRGTRPAGIATFGILPDLSALLPAVTYPHRDDHRFGMQGAAYIEANDPFDPFTQNLGVTWLIKGRAWSTTEPASAGQYDPTTYQDDDGYADGTFATKGYLPLMDLSGIPAWANPSGQANANYPPKSFSDYQQYMTRVGQERSAARATYPDLAHDYYQVTWEPDPGTGNAWQGTDADMVQMYKSAYAGLHASDSSAVVLGVTASSVSADDQMMTRLLGEGIGAYLDGFSYHGYYDAGCYWDHPPEDTSWGTELPAQMRTLRHLLATSLKPHARLVQSEMGIRYAIDGEYGAAYPSLPQLAEQGAVVARAHLIELGEGADTVFFFYSADFPGDVGSGLNFDLVYDPDDASTLWGTGKISPKPGFMMGATLTRLVDGTTTLGYMNGLPAGVYGYAFQRLGNGPVVTAMWTHDPSWSARATYALPVAAPGTSTQIAAIDAMGNPTTLAVVDGKATLSLGEYPVYVISGDAAAIKALVTVPEGYDPEL